MNWLEIDRLAEIYCAERLSPARDHEEGWVVDVVGFAFDFLETVGRLFSWRPRPAQAQSRARGECYCPEYSTERANRAPAPTSPSP